MSRPYDAPAPVKPKTTTPGKIRSEQDRHLSRRLPCWPMRAEGHAVTARRFGVKGAKLGTEKWGRCLDREMKIVAIFHRTRLPDHKVRRRSITFTAMTSITRSLARRWLIG